jgi:release factor glutamine methyltransferase
MESLLGLSRLDVWMGSGNLSESEILRVHFALKRLKKGEPMQYVLGQALFCGLKLKVSPAVLIPRPETEELVYWVKEHAKPEARILDVGCGSACISLALKSMLPKSMVYALDVSEEALQVASENAETLKLDVSFVACNILERMPAVPKLDIIVSNPPYISTEEQEQMLPHVLAHEPALALFVEARDPLIFYRRLAALGPSMLMAGGQLFFEINPRFVDEMGQMLHSAGYDFEIKMDMQERPRMMRAWLKT